MKRKGLQELEGMRRRFRGVFERFGKKVSYGHEKTTLLFKNVEDVETGELVTDHLWFNLTKAFDALNLVSGDTVEFDARVTIYEKGYRGRRAETTGRAWSAKDYKLSRPTKVEGVESNHQWR